MKTRASGILWITDADNTLWDTNTVFAEAQLLLLSAVETAVGREAPDGDRLAYVRDVDQRIAAGHHRGLRYSADLLAQGLAQRLSGRSAEVSAKLVVRGKPVDSALMSAASKYSTALRVVPPLRTGVFEGIHELVRKDAVVIVATEGSKDRIEHALEHHGLSTLVKSCIESPKTPQLYMRLAKASGRGDFWMIGDQLDRDIVPAKVAGFRTIYFPGAFTPSWHRHDDVQEATAVVANYLEGVQFAENADRMDRRPNLPAA